MKRTFLGALVLLIFVAVGPVGSASASVKVVPLCNAKAAVKHPAAMVFTCGDAGLQATGLHWKNWGTKRAKGFGTIVFKRCRPDCASGGVGRKRGKVTLYRKVRCSRHRYRYSRARVKMYRGPTTKQRLITCRR